MSGSTLIASFGTVSVVFLSVIGVFFFFSSRRRHTRCSRDWSSDVCSSDLSRFREFQNLRGSLAGHYTIRDAELDALYGERRGQQVSVVGNQGEQFAGLARLAFAQEELVEARRPSVQKTEAVLASSDLEERLDHAIHREFVAQDAVKIEGIEEHLAIRSERFVRKSQGNVEVAARQSETRVPIFLVA